MSDQTVDHSFDIFPGAQSSVTDVPTNDSDATVPPSTPTKHPKRLSRSFDGKKKHSAVELVKQLVNSECVFHVRIYDIMPFSDSVFPNESPISTRQPRMEEFNFILEALEDYIEGIPNSKTGGVDFSIPAELLGLQYYVALTIRGAGEKLRCRVPLHGLTCDGVTIERWYVAYDRAYGFPRRVLRVESFLSVPSGSKMGTEVRVPALVSLSDVVSVNSSLRRHLYGAFSISFFNSNLLTLFVFFLFPSHYFCLSSAFVLFSLSLSPTGPLTDNRNPPTVVSFCPPFLSLLR